MLGKPLIDTLERMSCGGMVLDAAGQVIQYNSLAASLLKKELGKPADDDQPLSPEELRAAIKSFLRQGETRFSLDVDSWVVIPRGSQRELILHALPVGRAEDPHSRTVLIFIDLDQIIQPSALALQKIFGLTAAEANLAKQILSGDTPAEIARHNEVKMATVQLAVGFDLCQDPYPPTERFDRNPGAGCNSSVSSGARHFAQGSQHR